MKFPKNRDNIYLVERRGRATDQHQATIAGFSNYDEAEDFKEACSQEWIDKVGHMEDVYFNVTLTTYYG